MLCDVIVNSLIMSGAIINLKLYIAELGDSLSKLIMTNSDHRQFQAKSHEILNPYF